ncbi:unnamed protein product [Menidia menidia]|uniref:(Atlantic silverside) hypothetical protein n=1 Tax=Menidia menidia TaxID=238744 RepID=A0A8S4BV75_9TELE|nr:unnamed protein product [Menidia menidia]
MRWQEEKCRTLRVGYLKGDLTGEDNLAPLFQALGQAFMDCCCCCCQECQPAGQAPPGAAQVKLKGASEGSIFFDKAKDTSAILSISS